MFGKCYATVLQLLSSYDEEEKALPYHIFCDLFPSFPFLQELQKQGYDGTGTFSTNLAHRNRNHPVTSQEEELIKKFRFTYYSLPSWNGTVRDWHV